MVAAYRETSPRADLAHALACLWSFDGDSEAIQAIAPDGCCELILHAGAPYLELSPQGAWFEQPRAVFAGQLTRPLHLRAQRGARVVAARFRPAGAVAFVQAPMAALTDRRAPLVEVLGAGMTGRLEAAALAEDPFAAIQAIVAERLATGGVWRDLAVEACLERLADAPFAVEPLARAANCSPRQLERRFARTVGVPPRRLASVLRFRRIFDALSSGEARTLSEAAQAAGYFDHPQLARDFRRFVGRTPTQFIRAQAGLATSVAGL